MQQLVAEEGCEQCVCREVQEDSPEKVASVQRSEGTKGTKRLDTVTMIKAEL